MGFPERFGLVQEEMPPLKIKVVFPTLGKSHEALKSHALLDQSGRPME